MPLYLLESSRTLVCFCSLLRSSTITGATVLALDIAEISQRAAPFLRTADQSAAAKEAEEEEEDGEGRTRGNGLRKRLSNQSSGRLAVREKRLIRNSWRKFCEPNPGNGGCVFIGMFAKHPEYLQLFPRFRDKELRTLRDHLKFWANACAVGHQLFTIVERIEDDEVLLELIRMNAANHLPRAGVRPSSVESLSTATPEGMMASNGPPMRLATLGAWERLFETTNTITRKVHKRAGELLTTSQHASSREDLSLLDPGAPPTENSKTTAEKACAGASTGQVRFTAHATTSGLWEKQTKEGRERPEARRIITMAPTSNVIGAKAWSVVLNSASSSVSLRDIAQSVKPRKPTPALNTAGTQAPCGATST